MKYKTNLLDKFTVSDYLNKNLFQKEINRKIGIVLFITCILSLILWISGIKKEKVVDGVINRPDYADSSKDLSLDIYVEGKNDAYQKQLEVNAISYTQEEIQDKFDQVYDQLLTLILNQNLYLSEVKSDLNLVQKVEGYPFTIEWYSENYSLVDSNGTVFNESLKDEEIIPLVLTVLMKYQSYQAEYEITIQVIPRDYTNEEAEERNITLALDQAESEDRNKQQLSLPEEINGQKVTYYYHKDTASPVVIIILGATAILILIIGEQQKKEKYKKQRKDQMKSDYAELITKLTLLAGAGMTIRKAWETIVMEYQMQVENGLRTEHFVYEEMFKSLNEMQAGISESIVYERFGQKCDMKEYLKLGALLQQNVRKGTKDLLRLLEQESFEAFEERKKCARKKGEEAGTKLLLPMIMMLIVIMVIVMIPAMISFNV